jgi:SAM-dependent methyltransferase
VFGVDLSTEMIRQAREAVPADGDCALTFEAGDAASLSRYPRESFDRIVAVFLFNYLSRAQMVHVLRSAREHLEQDGRFVFTVPHPCFPYMRPASAPFFFETEGHDYFSGTDTTYEGRIWHRDGTDVAVRCVHKTLADYFVALRTAGWTSMPEVAELHVTPEHVALDPEFFGPLEGHPLHLLFALETES